jgi:3-methyladenine DNA glycosylase AlkD
VILDDLRREVSRYKSKTHRINAQQFHKEKLARPWVLKSSVVRSIEKKFAADIKRLSKAEVLRLCEDLMASDIEARRFFAFEWAARKQKDFAPSDFARFERWLKSEVDNWGACDHLCGCVTGPLVLSYPELIPKVKRWTKSKATMVRRAAAVSLIVPLRKGHALSDAFEVADILLTDPEDLVQKGYGWMLKEGTKQFRDEIYQFVLDRRDRMPRTALRYAIEKLPAEMRREAMKK